MNKIDLALSFLSENLQSGEYKDRVFLAGGAVRDMELGLKPKDIDLVIDGNLDAGINFAIWITHKFGCYREKTNPVIFKTYGTASFSLSNVKYKGVDLSDVFIECVAPRSEKYSNQSRNPTVSSTSLKEDVFRRDFTINSLLKNLTTGVVLDLTGFGKKDIKNKYIRTTSDPDVIFSEDPLRMLRAIRFAFKYDCEIDSNIISSLKFNSQKIKNISQERIRDELNKILTNNNAKKAFHLLYESGLLYFFLPELCECYGVKQGQHHNEDVFNHILDVVENAPPILEVRLMALFHDIGKPKSKTIGLDGNIHFYKHDKIGSEISEKTMKRLKYPNALVEKVSLAVFHHMYFKKSGADSSLFKDKTLRRFRLKVGDCIDDILELMHSDNISHAESSTLPNQIPSLKERFKNLQLNLQNNKPKLPINGNDLIKLGLKPGPIFKELLDKIEEEWCQDPNISKEQCIEIVKNYGRI